MKKKKTISTLAKRINKAADKAFDKRPKIYEFLVKSGVNPDIADEAQDLVSTACAEMLATYQKLCKEDVEELADLIHDTGSELRDKLEALASEIE